MAAVFAIAPPTCLLFFFLVFPHFSFDALALAQQQPLNSNSELTVRTTSSVDIQVCAAGVLTDERSTVQTAIATKLKFQLSQTTAVYLIRQYTTALGTVCFLYVYQAPSPQIAAETEAILTYEAGSGLLSVVYGTNSASLQCSLSVVPWQGEDPPLPLWQVVFCISLYAIALNHFFKFFCN